MDRPEDGSQGDEALASQEAGPNGGGADSAPVPMAGRRGRKTTQGKADNWRSALSHGITSNAPVIPHMEDENAWHRHLHGIRASIAPEGHLEHALAERVANLLWRLNRVTRYEVVVTMHHIGSTTHDVAVADSYRARTLSKGVLVEPDPDEVAALQQARILPDSRELDKIMRYETHIHRQLLQTLHELEALQARRRGEPTHLARLDISATP
jgi:hypothetical protein